MGRYLTHCTARPPIRERVAMKAAVKRVYKQVGVRALDSKLFTITLDGRDLKTPARQTLALPTKELALGVAIEWDAQLENIRPATMPLMKLAATTIDQVPSIRPTMVDSMLRCLNSDLACFRSVEEPKLVAKEEAAFAHLLKWTAEELQLPLGVTDTMVLTHPAEAIPRAEDLLAEADDWSVPPQYAVPSRLPTMVMLLRPERLARARACFSFFFSSHPDICASHVHVVRLCRMILLPRAGSWRRSIRSQEPASRSCSPSRSASSASTRRRRAKARASPSSTRLTSGAWSRPATILMPPTSPCASPRARPFCACSGGSTIRAQNPAAGRTSE